MEKIDKGITQDLTQLPPRLDRKKAAEVLTQRYFPISNRTLERWPLTWRRLNGRALVNTEELLAEAQRRVEACTPIKGGVR
jgi:hypothetical protein